MATYWENSCSFGLRYVSWYKFLIVSLVFSHLGFWSGNLCLIAPFPDLCLLVPFYLYHVCCHGNHCAIRTTLILKTRYALCITCFIKQFVISCLLHCLNGSIYVKLQETHRISKILDLPSFNYNDFKTFTSYVQTSSTVL